MVLRAWSSAWSRTSRIWLISKHVLPLPGPVMSQAIRAAGNGFQGGAWTCKQLASESWKQNAQNNGPWFSGTDRPKETPLNRGVLFGPGLGSHAHFISFFYSLSPSIFSLKPMATWPLTLSLMSAQWAPAPASQADTPKSTFKNWWFVDSRSNKCECKFECGVCNIYKRQLKLSNQYWRFQYEKWYKTHNASYFCRVRIFLAWVSKGLIE